MKPKTAPQPATPPSTPTVREFASGATRETDDYKLDYEGFISPLVTLRYAQYMDRHRIQPDGKLRGSDDWQRGIPLESYAKSLVRHVETLKLHHRGYSEYTYEPLEDALCAIIFNASGYLLEVLLGQNSIPAASVAAFASSAADEATLRNLAQTLAPPKYPET